MRSNGVSRREFDELYFGICGFLVVRVLERQIQIDAYDLDVNVYLKCQNDSSILFLETNVNSIYWES